MKKMMKISKNNIEISSQPSDLSLNYGEEEVKEVVSDEAGSVE